MQVFIVEKNHAGQRLDKFLHKYLPQASTSFIYKMLRKKNITLNDKKAEGKEILELGDQIKCFFSDETFAKFSGTAPVTSPETSSDKDLHENTEKPSGKGAAAAPAKKSEKNAGREARKQSGKQEQSEQQPGKAESAKQQPAKADKAEPRKNEPKAAGGVGEYRKAYNKLSEENIRVIYEDDNILILNKPEGVLTQKAENKDLSLNEWMIGYLLEKGSITESELRLFKPSVCNRLDRNTSGLVLCGKSLAGTQKLNEIIKNRTIKKYYRTICIGEIRNPSVLDGNLTKDQKKNKVTIDEEGEPIKTAFTPIKKLSQPYTYLEVELITGKPHQIRAHLASIDHALVGDTKYGKPEVNQLFQKKYNLTNQLLHAYRLEFPVMEGEFEPLSEMVFLAPLPKKFEKILKDLK